MNTVVALPIVAAVPTIAPAMPAEMHPIADPVFAAIDNHKKAMQSLQAANAESNRVMDLADEAVGPSSIKVLDMREPSTPPGFHPYVEVNWLGDIEQYVPEAEYPELYALYRAELNERNAARAQFLEDNFGDTDKIIDGPAGAELEAADKLAGTVPTTLPGLLAVLSYLHGATKLQHGISASFDENNFGELLTSLGTAAQALAGMQA